MTMAIVKCKAYGLQTGAATRSKGLQIIELELTGAAADVAYDFGNSSGTFWTAVLTSSPTCGPSVLELFENVSAGCLAFQNLTGPQLYPRVQVASLTGAGQILKAVQNNRPNISFNAADGDTTYQLKFEWLCGQNFKPVVDDFVE
jgi:hypothetical protein